MSVVTRIERIAAGGEGVARLPDGRVVFVHRTAPGDEVELRVTESKRRWARGELTHVRSAGSERRVAPCTFYARCGGCTLEHLSYEAQLHWKGRIVADALERIGRQAVQAPEVVASPDEFRYRNRVSFTLVRLSRDRVVAGFHELNHPSRVLDITEACLLPEASVAGAWAELRAAWGAGARRLPAGDRLRLTIRAAAGGGAALLVEGGSGRGSPEELLAYAPALASVWHRPEPAATARLVAGREAIDESWSDEEVALTGAVFLQVNRRAAALLESYVLEVAGQVSGQRVIDAYCGIGLYARRLARGGAHVVGIELDPDAVREARRSSSDAFEVLEGPVERLLPAVLPADTIVLNPPRSGVHPLVCEALVAAPPRRAIYVSCNAATLARDIARVGATFRIRSLRCFDLFPQTAHVETVVELACVTS